MVSSSKALIFEETSSIAVLLSGTEPADLKEQSYRLAGKITENLQKRLNLPVTVGIGSIGDSKQALSEIYRQAQKALLQKSFIKDANVLIFGSSFLSEEELLASVSGRLMNYFNCKKSSLGVRPERIFWSSVFRNFVGFFAGWG